MVIFHHVNPKNLDEREHIQLTTAISSYLKTIITWQIIGAGTNERKYDMTFWDEESYCSNGNSTINVGGTIQWIKNNTVPALFKTS